MRESGKDAPVTRVYAEEILELDGQTSLLTKKIQAYHIAIIKAESTFRRIERRKMMKDAGVSESELDDLAKTVYELDDSLKKMTNESTVTTLEVDDIFKEVFDE